MNEPNYNSPHGLLRFLSKQLDVETVVSQEGGDIFIRLVKDHQVIGSRRLAKAKCCQADSPCIGPISIPPEFQSKYGLPAFIHVSLCYQQILEFWENQE